MKIERGRVAGFTLVELLMVIAIIGALIAAAIPNLTGANSQAEAAKCKAQLQAIEAAAESRAMDGGGWTGNPANLVTEGYLRQIPTCQWQGTTYQYQLSMAPGVRFTFADLSKTLSTKNPAGTAFCPIHGTIKEFREDGVTPAPLPPEEAGSGGGGTTEPPE